MAKAAKAARSTARKARARTTPARRTAARRKPVKAKTKPRAQRRPAQRFAVSHHREEDFDRGLRSYASYRDLGMVDATDGLVRAHVIRFHPPCVPEVVSKLHYHDVDFQMVYVLKGWITTELEGQGAITMRAGSAWLQPPRIKHAVLDYSDDCEVLEIVLPADFGTVELE